MDNVKYAVYRFSNSVGLERLEVKGEFNEFNEIYLSLVGGSTIKKIQPQEQYIIL